MKRALAALLLMLAAPGVAQPALDGMTVVTEQDGKRFVCALRVSDGAAVTDTCLPLVSQQQADRMAELAARIDSLTAEAAEAAAASEALRRELQAAQVEIDTLRARLAPFVAADARAATNAGVLDQAIALEQAAVKVGLLDDADLAPRTLAALRGIMADQGTPCSLTLTAIAENGGEEWLLREIYARILADLNIPDDAAALMLSFALDRLNDREAPRTRFTLAYQEAGDGDLFDKGLSAKELSNRNFDRLRAGVETALRNPASIALSPDQSSITLVTCP